MAYFRLSLLTPYTSTDNSIFYEDLITEFYPQVQEYESRKTADIGFNTVNNKDVYESRNKRFIVGYYDSILKNKKGIAHTYGETFSKTQNGQKTLSFNMSRYITLPNEWYENPFVDLISIGTQLLLTDQYNNEYFFTVTSIQHQIKENNVIYSVSCQDSFSYQTSRQNDGYTISNDNSDEDFIGAKTVDWWVINKIVPECYLTNYIYIPCSCGLYRNTKGQYVKYRYSDTLSDVDEIIKEAHTPPVFDSNNNIVVANDSDYFETIPFECNGSNVDAALIALGEELKLQINTFEHAQMKYDEDEKQSYRTSHFDRFFWFEPQKNESRIGLTYSPKHNIQSFNLTHKGDSLTTVLNVNGPTYDDEIITLLPEIPPFFCSLFNSQEWDTTSFFSGFFEKRCQAQVFTYKESKSSISDESWFRLDLNNSNIITKNEGNSSDGLYINIQNWQVPNLYENYSFINDDKVSNIVYTNSGDNKEEYLTPIAEKWELCYKNTDGDLITVPNNNNNLYILRDHKNSIYLHIFKSGLSSGDNVLPNSQTLSSPEVYIKCTRNCSDEELAFAKIADQCPWLENKLVDFSYFLTNNILSRYEYDDLMNKFQNELRIVNGHLMFYSKAYYNALHKKTEILATLVNNLDSLGAACQAAIVDPVTKTGAVSDYSYFTNAYNTVFQVTNEVTPILKYEDLLTEYFTKYFNSQQRFLKNLYNFRKYFDAQNDLRGLDLYKYTLNITSAIDINKPFYSFAQNQFIPLNNSSYEYNFYSGYNKDGDDTTLSNYGSPLLPVFYNSNGKMSQVKIASADKWKTELYMDPILDGNKFYCAQKKNNAEYNENSTYTKLIFKVPVTKIESSTTTTYQFNDTFRITQKTTNSYNSYNDTIALKEKQNVEYWNGCYLVTFDGKKVTCNEESVSLQTICWAKGIEEIDGTSYLLLYPLRPGSVEKAIETIYEGNTAYDELVDYATILDVKSVSEDTSYSQSVTIKAIYLDPKGNYTTTVMERIDAFHKYLVYERGSNKYTYTTTAGIRIGLVKESKKYLMETWLLKQNADSLSNIYYRNYQDFYSSFAKTKETSSAFQHLIKGCYSSIFIPEDEIDGWDADGGTDKIGEKDAWQYYRENFPITELYQLSGKYRITNKNDQYYFYRLNEKGQTVTKYIDYINQKNSTTDPYTLSVVENPYDYTSWQAVKYVTPSNESKAYRRTIQWSTGAIVAGVCSQLFWGPLYTAAWAIPACWLDGNTAWKTDGVSVKKWDNTPTNKFTNYVDREAVLYAPDANSYENYSNYTKTLIKACKAEISFKNWEDNLAQLPINKISYNSSKDLPWTINSSSSSGDLIQYIKAQNQSFTYLSAANNSTTLYYKHKYIRPLTLDSIVTKNNTYKVLCIDTSDDNSYTLKLSKGSYSAAEKELFGTTSASWDEIAYYPLVQRMDSLNLTSFDWNTKSYYTLRDLIGASNNITLDTNDSRVTNCNFVFAITKTSTEGSVSTIRAIVFEEYDYSKQTLYTKMRYNEVNQNYTNNTLYDAKTGLTYDFSTVKDLTEGYYLLPTVSKDCVLANTRQQSFDKNTIYRDKDGNRLYTIWQAKKDSHFVYLHSLSHTEENFTEDIRKFSCPIVKNTPKWEDGVLQGIETETIVDSYSLDFSDAVSDGTGNLTKTFKFNDNSITVTMSCALESKINGVSNGTFWYLYRDRLDLPILYENAASIEAQLTEYWSQAYTASKYCEYFLPETWTDTVDQDTNTFASQIYNPSQKDNDGNTTKVSLNNKFIPDVKIYTEGNKTVFNKYKYTYVTDPSSQSYRKYQPQDTIDAKTQENGQTVLSTNLAMINALAVLEESASNWYIEKIGTTSYYYAYTGGVKWSTFIQDAIKSTGGYQQMSGLYVMLYRLLKTCYTGNNFTLYQKYQDEHDNLWDYLYNHYGHILLENSYTSDSATTSEELLNLAQFYFKDKTEPERQYNLTIIDTASLDNYQGAEIRVGDGIKINASDYYDEYNTIYESLSKYLFISNISYTLRNAADITLTVNDIKYEDGIMKRLAKLIK